MSKQKKSLRDAVVVAFAGAYANAEDSGSKIGEVCSIAMKAYGGAQIPEEDATYIVNKLAESRGWEGQTAKVRKSEARSVLKVYSVLPEGIKAIRAKHGSCDWRAALRLTTCLKKSDGKLKPALAMFADKAASKVSPQGRVAGALKAWYKTAKSDKRAKILEAAALLGIKLGVKVDA